MLDTVHIVANDHAPERRGRTVPIEDWWGEAVKRELKKNAANDAAPGNQKELAEKLDIDPAHLNRAIKPEAHPDWRPVEWIVIAVSDELKLPYPFLIPETEEIALELAKQHRLHKRVAHAHEIAAGVPRKTKESQTSDLASEHASRATSKQKRTGRTNRARP